MKTKSILDQIQFTAQHLGRRTDESGWEHDVWRCALTYRFHTMYTNFRMGVGHNGKAPTKDKAREQLLTGRAVFLERFVRYVADAAHSMPHQADPEVEAFVTNISELAREIVRGLEGGGA